MWIEKKIIKENCKCKFPNPYKALGDNLDDWVGVKFVCGELDGTEGCGREYKLESYSHPRWLRKPVKRYDWVQTWDQVYEKVDMRTDVKPTLTTSQIANDMSTKE